MKRAKCGARMAEWQARRDPAAFFAGAESSLGIDPRTTSVILLDDTLENVQVARLHGWTAVHYDRDRDWRHEVSATMSRPGS